jgi:IS30 family transposase
MNGFNPYPKIFSNQLPLIVEKEFSNWKSISNTNDIDIYFADPGTPSQRGLNEHSNGTPPKKMDYQKKWTSTKSIKDSSHPLRPKRNHIPRKSLNYQTPLEVFLSYVNGKFCLA